MQSVTGPVRRSPVTRVYYLPPLIVTTTEAVLLAATGSAVELLTVALFTTSPLAPFTFIVMKNSLVPPAAIVPRLHVNDFGA